VNERSSERVAPSRAASSSWLRPYVNAIGRTLRIRSSRVSPRYSAMLSTEKTSPAWLCITPFGSPVVPDV